MESSSYPGLMGLMHVSVQDLMKIHGIGQVKAVQLKCIGELSALFKAAARPQIVMNNPSSIAAYYMEELRHEEQELVICMMSDVKGHFLGDKILTRGTATGSLVTPREIFMEALRRHAVSLILIHNHPSGDPTPSPDDFTDHSQDLSGKGELLEITSAGLCQDTGTQILQLQRRRIMEYMYRIRQQQKGQNMLFEKNIWNRFGKQFRKSLFFFQKQNLYREKYDRVQGTHDHCNGK